jgi:CheY-like chemotaxis protein
MNGRELAARLVASRPGLQVLFVSGYTGNVVSSEGVLDAGAAFLAKPFSPEQLAAKVREVLDHPNRLRRRILVIDDEDAVRGLLRKILEGAGYQVREAADGRKGVQSLAEISADLVITDLVMPEQEGLETLQIIRREHPHVKMIAISGAFGGQFLVTAEHLGAQGILRKPVEPQQLLQMVRQVLEH